MKKRIFSIFFMAFALVMVNKTWGGESTGTVTIDSPAPNSKSCGDVTVTGTYTLTTGDSCYWDIYTWSSTCAYVSIIVDGVESGFSASLGYDWVGIPRQISILIKKSYGSHHCVKVEMQAVVISNCNDNGCGSNLGIII